MSDERMDGLYYQDGDFTSLNNEVMRRATRLTGLHYAITVLYFDAMSEIEHIRLIRDTGYELPEGLEGVMNNVEQSYKLLMDSTKRGAEAQA